MLDVHPPDHTPHTWRDFLIHIATIGVGLLIAIGLEQTVEAVHRHHEAAVLRKELRKETTQVLADSRDADAAMTVQLDWLRQRIQQAQIAVWQQKPLANGDARIKESFSSPDIPLWQSAKWSGRTVLLDTEEVNAYAEVEYVQTHVDLLTANVGATENDVRSFVNRFPTRPDGSPEFDLASPEDKRTYLELLTREATAKQSYQAWIHVLLGAELAVRDGKTSLADIYASERESSRGTHVW